MSSLSVDGLVSGLDTTSLINQLISAESTQQTKLKTQLTATKDAAAAYRSVNTALDALRTAADALTRSATWGAASAKATAGTAATVTGTPLPGSTAFTVDSLAASHAVVSSTRWNSTSDQVGVSSFTYTAADGVTQTSVPIGGTGTLADAVKAINGSNLGLSATVVDTNGAQAGGLALQVTATKSGEAQRFDLGTDFTRLRLGTDAQLSLGDPTSPLVVTSSTNTFSDLVPGVTFTVSTKGPATVDVAADPSAVAASVKAVVDAANAALAEIKKQSNASSTTAKLKGDSGLRQVSAAVLDAVSGLVGTDGSPGMAGVQLTRDGTVQYDQTTFLAALADNPERTQRLLAGSPKGAGADGKLGTVDDVPATGVSGRLLSVVENATNARTGTLTTLAKGRDDLATDLQDRIDAWDDRLTLRRATLVKQFTAMETALSSLKSQSSWLAGQLANLPTSSS